MSTSDFFKIGDWVKKNQGDIAIAVGFILVALIAFGAGRLAAPEIVRNPIIIEEPTASSTFNILSNVSQSLGTAAAEQGTQNIVQNSKGMFVASKNGTKYYWPWCSWAERIKEENKVWFNSEKDALAAGFSPGACIASEAPAGYVKQ